VFGLGLTKDQNHSSRRKTTSEQEEYYILLLKDHCWPHPQLDRVTETHQSIISWFFLFFEIGQAVASI